MSILFEYGVALLPVLLFLTVLVVMDSFKLIRFRPLLLTIGIGAAVALGLVYLNGWLYDLLQLERDTFTRYLAPATEEIFKAIFLVYLIVTNRTGFLVDSAIRGFALGTGFALVENIFYHLTIGDQPLLLWLVRGFGTAFLHGGTMAIFAIVTRTISDRKTLPGAVAFMPGLLIAILIHSLFNHFLLPPLVLTGVTLVTIAILIIIVYVKSEEKTREWLGGGLDLDMDLIESITSGDISDTRVGKYLHTLVERFQPMVVADMLCLLRIHAELGVASRGMLLAREAGLKLPPDDLLKAKLVELKYLEKSVGPIGIMALHPFLQFHSVSQWQRSLLISG